MGTENTKRKAGGKAKGLKSTAKVYRTAKVESSKEFWELRLYVAGQTPKSLTAFANLKKICEEHLEGKYRIEVIDLLKNPQLARGDQIRSRQEEAPSLRRALPVPPLPLVPIS